MTDRTHDLERDAGCCPASGISRRDFLKTVGAGGVVLAAGTGLAPAEARAAVRTSAHIVIVGAGAGGITAAAKLNRWLDGARLTIIDSRKTHVYQPGLTLVANGIYQRDEVLADNADYIPEEVNWIQADAAEFDPEASTVVTSTGQRVGYDYLIVATGCHLDFAAIEGMETRLIGREGIGSTYYGPDGAHATYLMSEKFIETGGTALFTIPATPLKCAGAPVKAAFLTESRMREAGTRGKGEYLYLASSGSLFGQPDFRDIVRNLFEEKDIHYDYFHVLKAIDPGARTATFSTQTGEDTYKYDYIHVVPPMRAPDAVLNSPLAWQEGNFASGGWMEVDKHTLQHRRYPNVFGCGDVVGTPVGKTAASVKYQAPIAAENLVALIAGKAFEGHYNGYTSCPLVTGLGTAALAEFNYDFELTPTFPLIDETRESWIWWWFKVSLFKPYYFTMLRGWIPV
ncbi:MAG TPA: FAD-dependent oxidoreductase [Thiohalobacter sp.]|nr:FAD-dependent oxidoreductase [Thiohalobacter sp.]